MSTLPLVWTGGRNGRRLWQTFDQALACGRGKRSAVPGGQSCSARHRSGRAVVFGAVPPCPVGVRSKRLFLVGGLPGRSVVPGGWPCQAGGHAGRAAVPDGRPCLVGGGRAVPGMRTGSRPRGTWKSRCCGRSGVASARGQRPVCRADMCAHVMTHVHACVCICIVGRILAKSAAAQQSHASARQSAPPPGKVSRPPPRESRSAARQSGPPLSKVSRRPEKWVYRISSHTHLSVLTFAIAMKSAHFT